MSSRMHPCLRSPRAAQLVLLLVVALLAASCSRTLPTAPVSARAAGGVVRPATAVTGTSDDVVITLAPGADPTQIAIDYGTQLVGAAEGLAVLAPPEGTLLDVLASRLSTDPRVVTAEPNSPLQVAEARQRSFSFDDGAGTQADYVQQPAADAISLYAAHYASRGHGVLVAIIDTGADMTHPALAGRLAGGWDFVGDDPDPTDVRMGVDTNGDGVVDGAFGHGTHVAGIVALTAPEAKLLIVRVLDSDGVGHVSNVAAGIRWATEQGARVINMSLGMLRYSPAIRAALDRACSRGVVCVSSAGTWGAATPVEYPAGSPDVMAVGAVDATDQPAPWTSYGSFVAVCAPGVGVRSAFPGGGYRLWSGTSMSAGFVSGTAALLLGDHPGWTLADVRARIALNAQALDHVSPAQQGLLGAGGLDAGSALAADLPPGDAAPGTTVSDRPK